jgi:hypothetical protein
VTGPRRTLFRRNRQRCRRCTAGTGRIPQTSLAGKRAVSVNMRRHDAATVSRTVVEVREGSVRLFYQPIEWPHAVHGAGCRVMNRAFFWRSQQARCLGRSDVDQRRTAVTDGVIGLIAGDRRVRCRRVCR